MEYKDKRILAPMVRIGILPMRLLCLKYGADLVYSEEVIDYKMLTCRRVVNDALNTVDFVSDDVQHPVFQTCLAEKHAVVFQMGTCDAERALQVAKMVENDVAAIDLNMGCPKSFSIQGGMGAALLGKPETVEKILKTLVDSVRVPVTCKIRVLPQIEDTIKLVKMIESCGVAAIAVHGRTTHERPRDMNRNDVIRQLSKVVKIPIIANGASKEIKHFDDIDEFKFETEAASVMVARAAMWNPSIFRKDGYLDMNTVIDDYLKMACLYDSNPITVKYTMQIFLQYDLHTTERGLKLLEAKSLREICKIWDVESYYMDCVARHRDRVVRSQSCKRCTPKAETEFHANDDVLVLPVEFIRKHYPTTICMPKMILFDYAREQQFQPPVYTTHMIGKLFVSQVEINRCKFSSSFRGMNKKIAEQAAALAALLALDQYNNIPQAALDSVSWEDVQLLTKSFIRV